MHANNVMCACRLPLKFSIHRVELVGILRDAARLNPRVFPVPTGSKRDGVRFGGVALSGSISIRIHWSVCAKVVYVAACASMSAAGQLVTCGSA